MKLWIDDVRPMPEDFDILAKSADEAIEILKAGKITHVSFDHDLGDIIQTDGPIIEWIKHEKSGYDVAMWIEHQAYLGTITPFTFTVHSANPIGAKRIANAMKNAEEYWSKNDRSKKN